MPAASGAKREGLPSSLRERLALLECGVLSVAPSKARADARQETSRRTRALLGTSFWLGLGCGGALGGVMLLLALVTHPEQMPTRLRQTQAVADALAQPSPAASHPSASAQAGAPTQAAFDMNIRRDDGGMAPLALRILGVDSPENVEVLLRDVPVTAQLSRGERRDGGAWALRLAELEDLHLMLGDGTPDTFDMTVEVATAKGTRMAKAVAHVRVSEQRDVAETPAPPARPVAASIDSARQPAAPLASGSSVIEKPFRTEVTALARVDAPALPVLRPPPQGMSALGGPTDAAAAMTAQPAESRTVWWKLPPPVWTPFADGRSSH